MASLYPAIKRASALLVLVGLALSGVVSRTLAADLTTWPSQYTIRPWEAARLTAADVVGPDGIVYPDFTGVGVTGGIPDINNSTVRATYTIFDVTTYGAVRDGVTNDDAAVAAAATAARAHLDANPANKAILYFPTGTYVLDTPVVFTQSNIVIDGDGPALTIIKLATDTAQTGSLFTLSKAPAFSGYLTSTTFVPRGGNTLTLNADPAANTFTVGSWVRLTPTLTGAGTTVSDRYNNPDNHVIFTDPSYHLGRTLFAKVTAINSAAKTLTLDRSFTHDYFVNESPQIRRVSMLENSGVQDLSIETVAATATVDPISFDYSANSWIKNVKTVKARSWPIIVSTSARFEVRDCQFLGTWVDITLGGGVAYLGWTNFTTDSLMENCQASDLRHMAIFQAANRCVIRSCTFTGQSVQSPQLHGRFPHENLVEDTTFNTVSVGGTGTRGLTAYGTDHANSLVHGPNGPRNVFYNNRVLSGMGTSVFGGTSEGFIFAYNRILKTEDTEAKPAIMAMDRSFDFIVRGNIFQAIGTLPGLNLAEGTCTGWNVTDNKFYGTNGYLYSGDSAPAVTSNNRFFSTATTPDAATTPELASIYAWQKTNAATARLVLAGDRRTVTDTGGTADFTVVRLKTATTADLTVTLSTDIAGLSVPSTVTILAGQTFATFTVTGVNITGEQLVTLTASASGLLADSEKISVLDQNLAQPNFGNDQWPVPPVGLPASWKAGNYGQVTVAGTQSYTPGTDTWAITGGGLGLETFHGSLARSGRRFVYQTMDGDGEIRTRITSASGDYQVGLMIADDETALTDFIWVEPTGRVYSSSNDAQNGLGNGVPTQRVAAGTKIVPCWLRLKRTGSVFTAYRSTVTAPASESDWTVLATVDLYLDPATDYKSPALLDQRMHFGFFINSNSATVAASASFTGTQFTGAIIGTVPPPAAPTTFAAALSGNTQANLTWTDNATDETGYAIEVRTGSATTWNSLTTVAANTTAYNHTGLLDGLTYSYRIRALRSTDNAASAYSATASVTTTLSTAPLAPTGPAAVGLSTNEIQFTWADIAHNETSYQIERSTSAGSGFTLLTTLGAGATGYIDAGLADGAQFYYRARAVNGIGNSTYTTPVAGATLLIAPTNLIVSATSDTDVTLSWSDLATNETGYQVERSTTNGSGFAAVGTTAANATTFTDTTVVADTTYYYRVRAVSAVSQSDPTAQVTTVASNYIPAAFYEPFSHALSPTSVIGRAGSGNGGTGLWNTSDSTAQDTLVSGSLAAGRIPAAGNNVIIPLSTGYGLISLGLAPTAQSVVNPPASGSRTFWMSFTNRSPATISTNRVSYLYLGNASGGSAFSLYTNADNQSRYGIQAGGLSAIRAAKNTVAANTTYLYLAKVTVTDTDGNAANGLERVEARMWQYPAGSLPPLSEPTTGGLYRSPTTITSFFINSINITSGSNGTTSRFSYDELRIGSTYAQVALPAPPTAPSSLAFSSITTTATTLTWTDNATNETGYKIQRATTPTGPYTDIVSLTANTTTYTNTGLSLGTTYYYRVRASSSFGDSSPATGNVTTLGYTISGTILVSGSGLAGVTVSDGTRSAVTAANGTYTLTNVPTGNYTLTPTLTGYLFTPATLSASLTTANLTGQNFAATPPPPVVTASQSASGAIGSAFSYSVAASNTPTSYALTSGSLPPGITLNNTSGLLSGTPTTAGTFTPNFTATNSGGTSSSAPVTLTISNPALIVYEGFNYVLAVTDPDPDANSNGGNGLPATNLGGNPSGTSTGLRGPNTTTLSGWGADQSVVPGLTYSDANAVLATSGNALQRNSGTSFSVAAPSIYRSMTTDPFASLRSTASSNFLGWNGTSPTTLFFSVLLSVNALNTGTDNRLVLNLGTDNSSWNVYLGQSTGTTKWRYGDQAGTGADLGNAVANQTVLIVGRLSFNSATQFVTDFWFNPPLGQTLGTPTYTKTYTTTTSGGQFRAIQTRDGANVLTMDEFRLGTSYLAVTPPAIPPAAPSALAASASSGSQISLTWTDNANDETGFKLERSPNGSTGWAQISTPAANTTAATDSALAAGTTYYYRLRATNANGDSPYSATTGATTLTGLQSFRLAYGLAANGSQDLLTPAGDGVPNLLKYAFNLLGSGTGQATTLATPNASVLSPSGSAGLPFASVGTGGDAGKLQLIFIRRKASGSPGISYVVEFSDALASWAVNASATESVTSIDTAFERVTVTDSVASQPKRFARVRVSTP